MSEDQPGEVLYICGFTSSTISDLYDIPFYSRAGAHKKQNIVRSLQEVGTDVTILSPLLFSTNTFSYHSGQSITDEQTGAEVYIPPTVDVYGVNFVFAVFAATALTIKLLINDSADAILFYNFRAKHAIPAALGGILFKKPIILDYEDGVFLHDNPIIRWSGAILRRVCGPAVTGAICVNRPLAELAPTDNTVVVRGFPSVGMPDDLPSVEKNRDTTIVMFAGRFDRIRGIDTFLKAIPNVPASLSVEFWISGYGPDEKLAAVRNDIEALDDERVRFFGTLPWEEYRRRLVTADIFVNLQDPAAPLSRYTFPSKLLDFMSAGGIILSTDMSDLREDFESIFVFIEREQQPGNAVTDIVSAIQTDESPVDDNKGPRWVTEHCSHSQVGLDILSVIEKSCG